MGNYINETTERKGKKEKIKKKQNIDRKFFKKSKRCIFVAFGKVIE